MAYYTHTKNPIGAFKEKSMGNTFEFSINTGDNKDKYPHLIWVGDTIGWPYRYAKVQKTIAYVATDEDESGDVVEKWMLNKCWIY
jgi:hypothetical protein